MNAMNTDMNAPHPLGQPLQGVRVVEFEGIGPGPMAARILADWGASVTVVARPGKQAVSEQLGGSGESVMRRGKQLVTLDLKTPSGQQQALELLAAADVLIEGNRPGVMERLGLGPADCARVQPRLVYGRMTGWGQHGPLSQAAGHDLNYVALSGLLSLAGPVGSAHPPIVPPTVLGDATGALGLAFGIVCAVLDVRSGGPGRVVDAAIVDVVAMLGMLAQWIRGNGQLDGAVPSPFHDSPFYDTYRCADGRFITIGALEPPFYAQLLERMGLHDVPAQSQYDSTAWPALKQRFAQVFASRSRDEWCAALEGTDVCFAPVLSMGEAARHPHHLARGTFAQEEGGGIAAAAAPRMLPLMPAKPD